MSSSERLLLHVLGDDISPAELPREGMLVLGSAPDKAGLLLEGQGVADVHCAIGRTKDGGWAVKDLGSEYGTLLNGQRISQARLKPGDQLLLGSLRLDLRPAGDAPAATSGAAPPATSGPKPVARSRSKARVPQIKGYRVVDRLGSGAMGEVYLAVQESLDREVALKVLSKKLEADKMFVQSFQAEARAAAALNHPNVVTVHDVGEQDGVHYLTMEYMDRGSLEERVAKQGPLHWRTALDALCDAASGLVYAESRGIVHRDIKPDNLMQNHTGTTKIADLGLATRDNEEAGPGDSKIFGTPHFISPEQVRGEKADCRSDLYSLGATAFRLLTGHTPFEGDSTREILRAKLTEDPAPLRRYVTDIPEGLVQIVERLLRREPGERYPSASALLKELDTLKRGPDAAQVGAPPTGDGRVLKLGLPLVLLAAAALLLPTLFGDGPSSGEGDGPTVATPGGAETTDEFGPGGEAQAAELEQPGRAEDDDTQEKLFEIEAENEFLKLAQRDLDKPTRRDRLRELAQRFLGTTAATRAQEQADQLDGEILAETRARLEHDTQLGGVLSALKSAAALDRRPLAVGSSLRAMAAVPGQEELAGDAAFLAARSALENEVVAAALAELEAGLREVEAAQAAGRFDEARELLGDLLTRTDLPDFEEGRAPQRSAEILELRTALRARIEGLAAAEVEYLAARDRADVRAIARVLAGSQGLARDLAGLDFDAAHERVAGLTVELASSERRAWSEALADDLRAAGGAFEILSGEWGRWRRKSVPDPREARGATREALGAGDEGLRLNVRGSVEQVPWSAYAGHSRLLNTLFKDRLARAYSDQELHSIAALLRFCALSEALANAAEMFSREGDAVFTEREAEELSAGFEQALAWEQDPERRASLERESAAAHLLAAALRAGSDRDWTRAVSGLERLLEEYPDTLLVRLSSDGSLATAPR